MMSRGLQARSNATVHKSISNFAAEWMLEKHGNLPEARGLFQGDIKVAEQALKLISLDYIILGFCWCKATGGKAGGKE